MSYWHPIGLGGTQLSSKQGAMLKKKKHSTVRSRTSLHGPLGSVVSGKLFQCWGLFVFSNHCTQLINIIMKVSLTM